MDMQQLYEQKYQTEVQKFGSEQIGRRRKGGAGGKSGQQ